MICISCSVSMSSADVESSSTSIGDFFDNALAMLILCFCPPDRPTPLSPITVSYSISISSIKPLAFAFFAASFTPSNSSTSRFPILMFSFMESENKNTSCITTEIFSLICESERSFTSTPSIFTVPSVVS